MIDMFIVDGAFTVGVSLVSETVMVKLLVTVLPVPRLVATTDRKSVV